MAERNDTLDSLIKLAGERKKVKKNASVIDQELLDLGLGFYQFTVGTDKIIEHATSFKKLVKLKAKYNTDLVKIQAHQVLALEDYLKAQDKYSRGVEAMHKYKDSDNIKGISIDMEAAVSAAAKFEASWDAGVTAEAKLEAGYSLKYGSKNVSWTSGTKIAIQAKLEIKKTSIEAEASANAEISHNIESKALKIGNTKYSMKFYTEWKAYAKAEAKFKAEISLSKTNFVDVGTQAKVFAGIGVSGEIGVQIIGKGGTDSVRKEVERQLAIANLNIVLEAGALASFGSEFATASEETIGPDTYAKKVFKVAIGLGVGAEATFNILVLKELTDKLQEDITEKVKTKVTKLIGEEMITYLSDKYEHFKIKAVNIATCLGNDIYVKFHSESYKTLYHAMGTNLIKLEEQLVALQKATPNDKRIAKVQAKIKKANEDLLKYKLRIEGIRSNCAELLYTISEELSSSDLNKSRSFFRDPKILGKLSDANEDVGSMVTAIERVTAVNLEIIDIHNLLDPNYGDAEFDANTAKMNDLLSQQNYLQGSLEYIIEVLKNKVLEMSEE